MRIKDYTTEWKERVDWNRNQHNRDLREELVNRFQADLIEMGLVAVKLKESFHYVGNIDPNTAFQICDGCFEQGTYIYVNGFMYFQNPDEALQFKLMLPHAKNSC